MSKSKNKSDLIPARLGALRAGIMMALYKKGCAKLSNAEIRQAIEESPEITLKLTGAQVSQNVSAMCSERKFLYKQATTAGKKYYLSPFGQEVAKVLVEQPGQIELYETKRGTRKREEEQEEIDFGTSFNISPEANQLADNLTAILDQNRGYRELLLSFRADLLNVVKKLDKTLELDEA